MIYFIQAGGDEGPVKIGYAENPAAVLNRFSQLQVANPEPLHLLLTFPGTQEDERAFHWVLKNIRIRGEWFSMKFPLRQFVDWLRKTRSAPYFDELSLIRGAVKIGDGNEWWHRSIEENGKPIVVMRLEKEASEAA